MEWLIGFAGLWVLFQWILPIALLVIVAIVAMRWAQARNRPESPTFTSALPEEREAPRGALPGRATHPDGDSPVRVRRREE